MKLTPRIVHSVSTSVSPTKFRPEILPPTDRGTSMSPNRPRSPERLHGENERLKADLALANDAFDREVALRLRDEAERTLSKVEELWRVSAENEKLKGELQDARAAQKREQVHVEAVREALSKMEAERAAEAAELAHERERADAAIKEAEKLENTLACFNRHSAPSLCGSCGNLHEGRRKLQTASYRSKSPRFGKGFEHASCGVTMSANAALSAASRNPVPGPGSHDAQRDHRGAIISMGTRGSVEPYSSSVPIQ